MKTPAILTPKLFEFCVFWRLIKTVLKMLNVWQFSVASLVWYMYNISRTNWLVKDIWKSAKIKMAEIVKTNVRHATIL